ncbi:peptide/nickel transport system permease protein [Antricoccus suffuscus]|uniref:Peptide/nickel transport system permease protein n=1 Tax=Antricoccus suffuscus TaxID=1629062 RepID=A0A2T0ZVV2_9ACTN|nr:ABC transporter permease [Antricoccus suffuscus]PRZ40481.1 peptide/nickel transport system permease protein [Antricoccus suffuscus]
MRVLRLVRRRVLEAVITLLGASVLIWSLLPLAPGSPARLILIAQGIPEPTPGQISDLTDRLGLEQPVVVQYFHWLWNAVRGSFGVSYRSGRPVSEELAARLPASLRLAVVALVLAFVLAVALGVLAAYCRGRWPDYGTQAVALLSASVPSFVVALLLIQVLVIGFGQGKAALDGSWSQVWMPAVCLALGLADSWSRLLRANILTFMDTSAAHVLRSRGATRWRIVWRHALPNSAVPSLHALAVGVAALIGGAAIVETVFTWPGLGSFIVESVKNRDLPVIQAFTVLATLSYVIVSVLADLLSALIDRRIRVQP